MFEGDGNTETVLVVAWLAVTGYTELYTTEFIYYIAPCGMAMLVVELDEN